eukprot:GFYU01002773.1.p1 GENE.GFYU01002773.1~~GFYU01002773.1.p1  ORF type:complete len:278 (-),score=66.65 GFYU01002773.1:216-1049(-)
MSALITILTPHAEALIAMVPTEADLAAFGTHSVEVGVYMGTGCLLAHFLLYAWFKSINVPTMLCLEIISFTCCWLLVILGVLSYFEPTLEDPMYGTSPVRHMLSIAMLGYQIYDLAACVIFPELRGAAMIIHHAFTICLAYYGLHPFMQGYAGFFFGCTEISNVFLCCVDMFELLPSLGKRYPLLKLLVSAGFSFCFITFRLLLWPFVTYDMWVNTFSLLSTGAQHSTVVPVLFLTASVVLTTLQYMWGKTVVRVTWDVICGKEQKSSIDAPEKKLE